MKYSASVIVSGLAIFLTASAGAEVRKPVDPNGQFARRAGQITQLPSVYEQGLPANEIRGAGNATIISSCRIITNYHVVFGKSKRKDTNKIVMINNRAKGHEVNFAFDIDENGQFKRTVKAKVVGFANYMTTPAGTLGDMAVLELETCLDEKEYAQLDLSMAESRSEVPAGSLMTVSIGQTANGKNQVLVQEGCKSEIVTPIDGLFMANCESVPGMSGSAVYEMGRDKNWHWTGLTTKGTVDHGEVGLIAISAKTIASFLRQSFSEVRKAIAPMARDARQ